MRTEILVLTLLGSIIYATADEYDYDWNTWGRNLEESINSQVRNNLQPLSNLGGLIQQQVQSELKPLQNLGANIQHQVYQGLRPVREMESRFRIKFGNDGTTIASFKDRKFIIRSGVLYDCEGTISDDKGTCSGALHKTVFSKKEDYCYGNINTIINNMYCISNGGSISSGSINGKVYCSSSDDSPTLLISAEEYKKVCANRRPVHYKYFSNKPMGDHTPDIHCTGTQQIVCTMTETNAIGTNVHLSRGSFININ